jgi:hypothetical protein
MGLEGVSRAIENGAWNDASRERLSELESLRAAPRCQLETTTEPAPTIRLYPNAAEIYRAKAANLEASLNAQEIKAEVSAAPRALIDRARLFRPPTHQIGSGRDRMTIWRRTRDSAGPLRLGRGKWRVA